VAGKKYIVLKQPQYDNNKIREVCASRTRQLAQFVDVAAANHEDGEKKSRNKHVEV
jgi:hypothetical protein